jgi:two-component system, LytTR family, sensor kinase
MKQKKQSIPDLINQFDYSGWRRIGIHLLFWSIVYFFVRFETDQYGFAIGDKIYEVIVLRDFSIWIISHYFVATFVIPKLLNAHWLPTVLFMFLTYVLIHSLSYASYKLIFNYFQSEKIYKTINRYYFSKPFFLGFFDTKVIFYDYAIFGFNTLISIAIKISKDTFQSRIHNIALEKENLKLEMNFLKAQVNPHFLFNTLNNVYSLIVDKDEDAANILIKLSDLMRYTLYETNTEKILLSRELKFIEDYISLEKVRHQKKVKISFQQNGEANKLMIPPLILITFVENAFKHGVNNTIEASWIKINVEIENNILKFAVLNSKPKKLRDETLQGGIGVVNVQKRLQNLYPNTHSLIIQNKPDTFYILLTLQLNE